MTLYPFDRQNCSLLLENWAYSSHYVNLWNGSDVVQQDGYHDSGTYWLTSQQVKLLQPYQWRFYSPENLEKYGARANERRLRQYPQWGPRAKARLKLTTFLYINGELKCLEFRFCRPIFS